MGMLRLFGEESESAVDGPGLRYAVFVQGCAHNCPGCHNQGSHDPDGGYEASPWELAHRILLSPICDGVSISGGEPLDQAEELFYLVSLLRHFCPGISIWLWTGYTYGEIMAGGTVFQRGLLRNADVVVDGRFEEDKASHTLLWRGSSNQRVIDVCATEHLMAPLDQVVEWEGYGNAY